MSFARSFYALVYYYADLQIKETSFVYRGKRGFFVEKIFLGFENLENLIKDNEFILGVEDFIKMREECNVDGVMIGRGVVGNPFLIKEIDNSRKLESTKKSNGSYISKNISKG